MYSFAHKTLAREKEKFHYIRPSQDVSVKDVGAGSLAIMYQRKTNPCIM